MAGHLSLTSLPHTGAMRIFAHRGASGTRPENTFAAFTAATRSGRGHPPGLAMLKFHGE